MADLSDPVTIGVVVGPHGVRGTLRVRPTGSGRHLRPGAEPYVAGRRRRISSSRETPKGFLLDLEGIHDRSEARSLNGTELFLDRVELDRPDEDEFYVGDLIDLSVIDERGDVLGRVAETFDTGAHEVLVVRSPDRSPDLFVPFTLEHVPEVDLPGHRIVVRPPEE